MALKASVVEADERDSGLRHILNYGHALERATYFRYSHGEAVGVGTVFAGPLAGALGRISRARAPEHLDAPGVPEQVVAATLAAMPDDQHARSVDGRGSRPCPNCC